MNDQKFKKHAFLLLIIFSIFTIVLLRGNQESVNVIYYLLPLGLFYALYVSLAKMRYDKKTGKSSSGFEELSVSSILVETLALGSLSFILIMLIRLISKREVFAFDRSLIEDYKLSLFSWCIGLVTYKLIIYFSRKLKKESSNAN